MLLKKRRCYGMSKSNEQLLNLAKQIAESESSSAEISEEDIFERIKK